MATPRPANYSVASGVTVYGGRFSTGVTPPVDPPPPSGARPVINQIFLDGATRLLHFDLWQGNDRYNRFIRLQVYYPVNEASTTTLTFKVATMESGGKRAFLGSAYVLHVDEVPTSSKGVTAGVTIGSSFVLPIGTMASGWRKIQVFGNGGASEISIPFWVFIYRAGMTMPTQMPVLNNSYDVAPLHGLTHFSYAMVPSTWTPPVIPLTNIRTPEPFSTALNATSLHLENITAWRGTTIFRPNVNKDGIVSTYARQPYEYSNISAIYPTGQYIDGERNVGAVQSLMHIMVDRHGGAYATSPWGVVRIETNGKITTRAGFRYVAGSEGVAASYWEDGADQITRELVGDWSAVPSDRRRFRETWGLAFDTTTTAQGTGTTTVVNPTTGVTEVIHNTSVRAFVADTQMNRIALLTFPGNSFTAPPAITEFITGLDDPWDCVHDSGFLYLSERKANRISKYNATTGAFIEHMVEANTGLPLWSYVDSDRFVRVTNAAAGTDGISNKAENSAAIAERRQHPCLLPEGLFIQDGWLYFAALVLAQVRRVNLTTKVVEVVCSITTDTNSRYAKIALSDGTFGPRGTVFIAHWSASLFGLPEARLPGGARWALSTNGDLPRGRGGAWGTKGYVTSVGVGGGRLYWSTAHEGVFMLTKAQPSDPTYSSAAYRRGRSLFSLSGYRLLYEGGGYTQYGGWPLPWGENADLDTFLEINGHVRPT